MIREHEYYSPDDAGKRWCRHCGALSHERQGATCIERATPGGQLRPEPARRVFAVDDFDTIGRRVADIAADRKAAPVEPAVSVPVGSDLDFLCG